MRLRSIDRAVLGALLPSGASPLLRQGLLDTGFEAFLVDFDAAAPTDFCRIFRLALVAAGWVAPPLIGHAPPMSRLNSGDRERALAAMNESRLPDSGPDLPAYGCPGNTGPGTDADHPGPLPGRQYGDQLGNHAAATGGCLAGMGGRSRPRVCPAIRCRGARL